jgi:phytoene synthase
MRHADDISDNPNLTPAERRAKLEAWLDGLHRAAAGEPTDDPVLLALADSQHRFHIPVELLEKLVYGTAMDCADAPSDDRRPTTGGPAVLYRTFDELYDYCYHVASVVGLVCIKIFGYRDAAAEPLAEHVGVAFQLTNIIRDIKEDAGLGRIYLPQEDLDRFAVGPALFLQGTNLQAFRPLLQMEAERARQFYAAADELIPLVEDECQPALWTLVTIYRRLLEKIAANGYNVFGEKIRLTTREKLLVLAKGMWRRFV